MFDALQDTAARVARDLFKLDGRYWYQDRLTGECFEFLSGDIPIETELLFEIEDTSGGVTVQKKGRGFLIKRATMDSLTHWLSGRASNPIPRGTLPHANNFFIVEKNGEESRYRIEARNPVDTIGTNNALYRFNCFLESSQWPVASN